MDIRDFNARWLQAWSNKDVEAILEFFAPNGVYRDGQSPDGIEGTEALRSYLSQMFAATPPMRYETENLWPIERGYVVRWLADVEGPEEMPRRVRGVGVVLLEGERVALNEVYTHSLLNAPVFA